MFLIIILKSLVHKCLLCFHLHEFQGYVQVWPEPNPGRWFVLQSYAWCYRWVVWFQNSPAGPGGTSYGRPPPCCEPLTLCQWFTLSSFPFSIQNRNHTDLRSALFAVLTQSGTRAADQADPCRQVSKLLWVHTDKLNLADSRSLCLLSYLFPLYLMTKHIRISF